MTNSSAVIIIAFFLVLVLLNTLKAESSNIVIEVISSRIRTATTPDSTPLEHVSGLALRQQGQGHPQTDLSIRGSSFSSVGLTLDGLSLRNAQTEHWHASIATPTSWLEQPSVVTGIERFRLSTGHPAGSVALSLAPLLSDENRLTFGGGDFGTIFGGAELTIVDHRRESSVGTSAFISYNHSDQTDSRSGNYLDRIATGGRLSRLSDKTQGDLLATISYSEFGAQGFYGTSAQYPAEERLKDSMVFGSLKFLEDPDAPASISAAWRQTDDTYFLNRYQPSSYRNEHTTDLFALHGDKRTILSDSISIDTRAESELETIKSDSLGDHERSRSSLAVIPNWLVGEITFSAGGSIDFFSNESPRFLPAAGLEWEFRESHALFVNYTEALRQPSYTELNYESPDSLGNANLERQHNRNIETGYKGESDGSGWKLALFYEYATETVDWVKKTKDSRWDAVNLDETQTFGAEVLASTEIDSTTELSTTILMLKKNISEGYYAGRYVLDYPVFSADMTLKKKISSELLLTLTQLASKYESNPVRQGGEWLIETTINVRLPLPFAKQLLLNAGIRNIFDDKFQFYPGQNSLGRTFYSSLTYSW